MTKRPPDSLAAITTTSDLADYSEFFVLGHRSKVFKEDKHRILIVNKA